MTSFEIANKFSDEQLWAKAVLHYEVALAAEPEHEWALNNVGFCLARLDRFDEALAVLRRCVAAHPENHIALANLVVTLEDSGDKYAAIPYRRLLVEAKPEIADHPFALANILLAVGRVHEALVYYQRAMEIDPRHRAARSNYLLATNYADGWSPEAIAAEHLRCSWVWSPPPARRPMLGAAHFDGKVRVGYLSGDLATHPVGKTMAPIFEALAANQHSRVSSFVYSDGVANTDVTDRIRRKTVFRDICGQNDGDVESLILADRIDILVELTGHTGGHNRLAVLAKGVAPVQVSYLGYPNTTGCYAIDYRLTDKYCDTEFAEEGSLYVEELVRMDHGAICFEAPELPPLSRPRPFRRNGYVTFGSFNNPSKVSATAMDTWAAILMQVPNSRLVAKYGSKFNGEYLRERWRDRFASQGVDPRRLDFLPSAPTARGHLEAIGSVDIALDSFPYQGTITTLETLAMDIPVITLEGPTCVRRASSAILRRLDPEGYAALDVESTHLGSYGEIAKTLDWYIQSATAWARDLPKQNFGWIRENFLVSEVCDIAGYAAGLEATYQQLWDRWKQKVTQDATQAKSKSDDGPSR